MRSERASSRMISSATCLTICYITLFTRYCPCIRGYAITHLTKYIRSCSKGSIHKFFQDFILWERMYITVSNTYLFLASGTRHHSYFFSALAPFSTTTLLRFLVCYIGVRYQCFSAVQTSMMRAR